MTGGVIVVEGNAGDSAGAALPGSKVGVNRGTILVRGDVGKGAGESMRRGMLVVGGGCRGFIRLVDACRYVGCAR